MIWPGAIWGDNQNSSVVADQQHTVNYIWEPVGAPGSTSQYVLLPLPGVEEIVEAGASPGRAHFFEDGREFAVIGTTLYEISEGGTATSRGTVATNSNPASICSNGDGGGQLLITSGGNAYYLDLATNVLTQIAALNGKATQGVYSGGYGVVLDSDTSTAYSSALLDFSSFTTGTDFAQNSASSDPWESVAAVGEYLWFIGQKTSQAWFNAGTSGFPFAKYPSGPFPYGIKGRFSRAVGAGSLVWFGTSDIGERQVVKAVGLQPEVVSTFAMGQIFAGYSEVDDAQADMIDWKGHQLYIITFPTERVSWGYDLTTDKWGQIGTWLSEDNIYAAWRPRWHAMAFGEHRMLDAETGSVYRLTETNALDVDGRPIRYLRRFPGLSFQNRRLIYPGLELEMERGIGTSTGQGTNPQVMLRLSKDGGKTWGTEQMRSAGKIGEYGKRIRWNRLGAARHLVAEVVTTDPVPWKILNAYLDPDPIGLPQRGAA